MYYSYSYKASDWDDVVGVFLGLMAFVLVMSLIVTVLYVIAQWNIFKKAGRDGWKAIIPFYNMYTLTEISGYNGWLFLISFVPGAGALVWTILVSINLSKAFGKSSGFAVGLVLLNLIFQMILAFDSSTYQPNAIGAAPVNTNNADAGAASQTQATTKAKKAEDPWIEGK